MLSEAVYSSIMNVRVLASRILFSLLKNIQPEDNLFENYVLSEISKSVLFMIKQKVSTYRQLGIKLCSLPILMDPERNGHIEN